MFGNENDITSVAVADPTDSGVALAPSGRPVSPLADDASERASAPSRRQRSPKAPLRVALIGAGRIAAAHLEGYRALQDEAEVVGVVAAHAQSADRLVRRWGVPRAYADVRTLLADPRVDAVDVCLPHHLHRDVVTAACAAGKHVLVEKPIARSAAEATAMIEAAREAGVTLMVAHNHVYNPVVAKAREILEKGLIGRVHLATAASYGWFLFSDDDFRRSREVTGGGILIDTGIHFVYLLQHLLGPVQSVTTIQGRLVREEMEGEDTAIVALRFESGALADLTTSYGSRGPNWEKGFPTGWEQTVYLLGTDGALRFSLTENTLWFYSEAEMPMALKPSSGWTTIKVNGAYADSFREEVRRFVECVQTGTEPTSGGTEGKEALDVIEAAYRSARESRTIYLDRRTT